MRENQVLGILIIKFMKNQMDNTELIKEIRLRWGKLYEDVRQNKITSIEYAKRRRVYEHMIWELLETNETNG